MFPAYADGVWRPARAPVASIAADGAQAAALDDLAQTLHAARREGRLILRLPLAVVEDGYLLRDRLPGALDPREPAMAALIASLAARGQQTAIEVADLGAGRYGLISGWRRLGALRHLGAESVLAIARPPAEAQAAYLAMVEENEVRAGLSYYERARIVTRAADSGVFADDRAALGALFASASRPRRSKIGSFVRIVRALDGALRFPASLNERQGLALAAGLDRDKTLAPRLISAQFDTPPIGPAHEARLIATALAPRRTARPQAETGADTGVPPPGSSPEPILGPSPVPETMQTGLSAVPRVAMVGPDQMVVQGAALTDPALQARLIRAIQDEISLWQADRD